jgi:hypothetical protein
MSQINFQRIPGLIAVYRLENDRLVEVHKNRPINVDLGKLASILKENMEIGSQEAKRLKLLDPFLGFAMIVDDIGITFIGDLLIITDARGTNWDMVIKEVLRVSGQ